MRKRMRNYKQLSQAQRYQIEIGDDMSCFGDADRLASWEALCPGNNESAGQRNREKHAKATPLSGIFYASAPNTKSSLAAKYRSLMVRRSHKKSSVAIAHKIIRIIYFMLSRHEPYRDPGVDHEAMSAKKMRHAESRLLRKSASCQRQNLS